MNQNKPEVMSNASSDFCVNGNPQTQSETIGNNLEAITVTDKEITEEPARKDKWGSILKISIAVLAALLLIFGIVGGVYLSFPSGPPSPIVRGPEDSGESDPNEQTRGNTDGVRTDVRDMILQTYSDPNKVQAMLQLASVLNVDLTDSTPEELSDHCRHQFRTAQCAQYYFGREYIRAFLDLTEVQFNSSASIENYLRMIDECGTSLIQLTSNAQTTSNCNFQETLTDQLAARRIRNLQQSARSLQEQEGNSGSSDEQGQEQEEQENCAKSTVLHYVNGLGSAPGIAANNMELLRNLTQEGTNTQFDEYSFLPPQTTNSRSSLARFVDSYANLNQATRFDLLKMMLLIVNDIPQRVAGELSSEAETFFTHVFDSFAKEMLQTQNQVNVDQHYRIIRQHLQEGKKVVLVARSQGSIYTNLIYNRMTEMERQSVGLVYIGPAAKEMSDGTTNYLTNPNDWTIAFLKIASQGTGSVIEMPLQYNAERRSNGGQNHAMDDYITLYEEEIKTMISDVLNTVVSPSSQSGDGPITIQIEWDDQPDIDLHVWQPNGAHVYYGNQQGQVGRLDRDCTWSYGPEHYYTNCSTIQLGTYVVKMNFYSGTTSNAVSNGVIRVQAGTQNYARNVTLINPLSYSGDSNPPYYICDIVVSEDTRNGGWNFQIDRISEE